MEQVYEEVKLQNCSTRQTRIYKLNTELQVSGRNWCNKSPIKTLETLKTKCN